MTNREQRRAAEHGDKAQDADKHKPSDAPREERPQGEVVEDAGGSGAPSGGQVDGRQGDQQGIKY